MTSIPQGETSSTAKPTGKPATDNPPPLSESKTDPGLGANTTPEVPATKAPKPDAARNSGEAAAKRTPTEPLRFGDGFLDSEGKFLQDTKVQGYFSKVLEKVNPEDKSDTANQARRDRFMLIARLGAHVSSSDFRITNKNWKEYVKLMHENHGKEDTWLGDDYSALDQGKNPTYISADNRKGKSIWALELVEKFNEGMHAKDQTPIETLINRLNTLKSI